MRPYGNGQYASYAVDLRDLLQSRPLADLGVHFQSDQTTRVQDLVLITEIEEIMTVGPDTIVLLTDDVPAGSWIVSAALHYAWERRACAVVSPANAVTDAAIEIARRLDVTLISADRDVSRLGIEMAIQLGIARAGVIAHVQSFTERLDAIENIPALLRMISREFEGARVQIRVSDTVTMDVRDPADEEAVLPSVPALVLTQSAADESVSVPIPQGDSDTRLAILGVESFPRDYVEQMLHAAAPTLRALLYQSRLESILESLPTMSLASLLNESDLSLLDEPASDALFEALHSIGKSFRSVCILVGSRENLGAAVHQVWQRHFPDVPLAPIDGGWLAFVPTGGASSSDLLSSIIQDGYYDARVLGLSVGISRAYDDRAAMVDSVREAWLAARIAAPTGTEGSNLIEFDEIQGHLLERLVPARLAERLAGMLVPDLLADAQAEEITAAVVAYLASRGSISRSAELLGVHRNTLQARVRRAEELGVPLSDPSQVLSLFMLLSAVQRESASSHDKWGK